MTPADLALKALAEKATPGPWFTAPDDAKDAPVHSGSGLGLVDTGRSSDWPIARLCEWPEADYIAGCSPERIIALLSRIERLTAALVKVRELKGQTSHYAHHDPKGTAGANCPACHASGEITRTIIAALAAEPGERAT